MICPSGRFIQMVGKNRHHAPMHRRPGLRAGAHTLRPHDAARNQTLCPRSPSRMGQQRKIGYIRRYPQPSGRQPATVIIHDFIHRPGIQNAHPGYPLEERIQRSRSFSRRGWRNTGQTLLNRTLQSDFYILAGQTSKPLRELFNPSGTNVHGPPTIIREHRQHTSIWGRDCAHSFPRGNGSSSLRNTKPPAAARMPCRRLR